MSIDIYFVLGAVLAIVVIGIAKPFLDRNYKVMMMKVAAKHGTKTAKKIDGIIKVLVDNGLEHIMKNEDEVIKSALKNFKLDKQISVEDVKNMKVGYKKGKKFMR